MEKDDLMIDILSQFFIKQFKTKILNLTPSPTISCETRGKEIRSNRRTTGEGRGMSIKPNVKNTCQVRDL